MSYTSWQYTPLPDPTPPSSNNKNFSAIDAAAKAHAAHGVLGHIPSGLQEVAATFLLNVTNTGTVDSDDVVLGFLVPPGAGQGGVPLQELFGFERVHVLAGQTVTVYLGAQVRARDRARARVRAPRRALRPRSAPALRARTRVQVAARTRTCELFLGRNLREFAFSHSLFPFFRHDAGCALHAG